VNNKGIFFKFRTLETRKNMNFCTLSSAFNRNCAAVRIFVALGTHGFKRKHRFFEIGLCIGIQGFIGRAIRPSENTALNFVVYGEKPPAQSLTGFKFVQSEPVLWIFTVNYSVEIGAASCTREDALEGLKEGEGVLLAIGFVAQSDHMEEDPSHRTPHISLEAVIGIHILYNIYF